MSGPSILVLGRSGLLASALAERGRGTVVTVGRPDFDLVSPDASSRLLNTVRPAAVINAAAYTAVDRAERERAGVRLRPQSRRSCRSGKSLRARRRAADPHLDRLRFRRDEGRRLSRSRHAAPPQHLRSSKTSGRARRAGSDAFRAGRQNLLDLRAAGKSFVTRLLDWAEGRDSLTIVSDQRGKPTYAPALAEALLIFAHSMIAGSATGGLMHLAGETALSRAEQAQIILDLARDRGGPGARVIPIPSSAHPTAARGPPNAILDCALAAQRGIALGPFRHDIEIVLDCLLGPAASTQRHTA